jgi:hypothetical protein
VSKVFKSLGKIFKSVIKTVIKIAPYALAAAAVVFTGGAALGILPAFGAAVGGVVSSLGLSAAVTGALTGAITSAGFGAAIGFVTGGKKGMQRGALMGALSGGVLGAVSPGVFGIVKGASGAVTTANALSHAGNAFGAGAATTGIAPATTASGVGASTSLSTAPTGLAGSAATAASAAPPISAAASGIAPVSSAISGVAPVASAQGADALTNFGDFLGTSAPATAANQAIGAIQTTTGGVGGIPASGGNGILSLLNKNPTLVGSVLTALGGQSGVSSKDLAKQVNAEIDLKRRSDELAFGGAYAGKSDPFGIGNLQYTVPTPRFYYDAKTNTVVDRQAQGS